METKNWPKAADSPLLSYSQPQNFSRDFSIPLKKQTKKVA